MTVLLEERREQGRSRREDVPRSSHAEWTPRPDRPDPIALLEASNADRIAELVPIRFGRMVASPFAFLRGAAQIMADDLAPSPTTGLTVQACGDCHLMNFGLFATPERELVFGLNDFDETLRGPWEWDVKRLAASIAVAARSSGLADKAARAAVGASMSTYRSTMWEHAAQSPLDVWYARLSVREELTQTSDPELRRRGERLAAKARRRNGDSLFPRLVEVDGDQVSIIDQPPLLFHPPGGGMLELAEEFLATYRASLSAPRRALLDRYTLRDAAMKVVGVGSVGTMCFVVLLTAGDHPLFLQVKEAGPSVLEPFVGEGAWAHDGERIVVGQQLMQSASDVLLGWGTGRAGRHFYVRQLRDMKLSVDSAFTAAGLRRYGEYCARALARAHANTGDAASIAGYLGRGHTFDDAVVAFARAYADQTEVDHRALEDAVRDGRIEAMVPTDA